MRKRAVMATLQSVKPEASGCKHDDGAVTRHFHRINMWEEVVEAFGFGVFGDRKEVGEYP